MSWPAGPTPGQVQPYVLRRAGHQLVGVAENMLELLSMEEKYGVPRSPETLAAFLASYDQDVAPVLAVLAERIEKLRAEASS